MVSKLGRGRDHAFLDPNFNERLHSAFNVFRRMSSRDLDSDPCFAFGQVWDAVDCIRPFLWQRGLSLYYRDRFAEGAAQFRDDVAVNPNDTEESIWAFLCESALQGPEAARRSMLQVRKSKRVSHDCSTRRVLSCKTKASISPSCPVLL